MGMHNGLTMIARAPRRTVLDLKSILILLSFKQETSTAGQKGFTSFVQSALLTFCRSRNRNGTGGEDSFTRTCTNSILMTYILQ